MNLFAKQKQKHRGRGQMYGQQGRKWVRAGMDWEIEIDRQIYTLLCKKIGNKGEPAVQHREHCSVLCAGKGDTHIYVCVCVSDSLGCIAESNTTL